MSNKKSDAAPINVIDDTIDLLQEIKELPASYIIDVLRYARGDSPLAVNLYCAAPRLTLRCNYESELCK